MKKVHIYIVAACMALSGCQVMDPYTGESQTSNATKFGLGAALICGLIGSRDSGKRARNAAAGCGAIGAGVGAYMDHQEQLLREQLVNSGVQIERDGDTIRLVMPNKITFETDRYDLKDTFTNTLESVVVVLNKYVDTTLVVEGHTDSIGAADYNMELSQRRANAVANYLVGMNMDAARVAVTGKGEFAPVASNDNDAGRALNRRVELRIAPKQI